MAEEVGWLITITSLEAAAFVYETAFAAVAILCGIMERAIDTLLDTLS